LLIALMIEEMTREIGYRVSGVAHTMAMASREFGKRNYDAVLLTSISVDNTMPLPPIICSARVCHSLS
jgi:hypothetical protein